MGMRNLENLKLGPQKNMIPVVWNGKDFRSKAELARYVNRSEGYIGKAIYYGWKIKF
jgi:hypothetical protein